MGAGGKIGGVRGGQAALSVDASGRICPMIFSKDVSEIFPRVFRGNFQEMVIKELSGGRFCSKKRFRGNFPSQAVDCFEMRKEHVAV